MEGDSATGSVKDNVLTQSFGDTSRDDETFASPRVYGSISRGSHTMGSNTNSVIGEPSSSLQVSLPDTLVPHGNDGHKGIATSADESLDSSEMTDKTSASRLTVSCGEESLQSNHSPLLDGFEAMNSFGDDLGDEASESSDVLGPLFGNLTSGKNRVTSRLTLSLGSESLDCESGPMLDSFEAMESFADGQDGETSNSSIARASVLGSSDANGSGDKMRQVRSSRLSMSVGGESLDNESGTVLGDFEAMGSFVGGLDNKTPDSFEAVRSLSGSSDANESSGKVSHVRSSRLTMNFGGESLDHESGAMLDDFEAMGNFADSFDDKTPHNLDTLNSPFNHKNGGDRKPILSSMLTTNFASQKPSNESDSMLDSFEAMSTFADGFNDESPSSQPSIGRNTSSRLSVNAIDGDIDRPTLASSKSMLDSFDAMVTMDAPQMDDQDDGSFSIDLLTAAIQADLRSEHGEPNAPVERRVVAGKGFSNHSRTLDVISEEPNHDGTESPSGHNRSPSTRRCRPMSEKEVRPGVANLFLRLVAVACALYLFFCCAAPLIVALLSDLGVQVIPSDFVFPDLFQAFNAAAVAPPMESTDEPRSLEQDAQVRLHSLRSELNGFVGRFEAKLEDLRAFELKMPRTLTEVVSYHQRTLPVALSGVQDPGHALFAELRVWLLAGDGLRAVVACTASALLSEATVLVIAFISCAGPTFRPMLAVILVFLAKACLQAAGLECVTIPAPGAAAGWPIWEGCPSLFVVRGAGSNTFCSARVALCGVACGELLMHTVFQYNHWGQVHKATLATRVFTAVAAAIIFTMQVSLSLALQVSWTADVFIALVTARFCNMIADGLAHYVDAYLPHS